MTLSNSENMKQLLNDLAAGYCAILEKEKVAVYTTSHIHLGACYKLLPPTYHDMFDRLVQAELAPKTEV